MAPVLNYGNDDGKDLIRFKINARDATWREATSVILVKVNLHSSHGPDHQLQRRQRVYRHQGVQHALVLVQSKFGNVVV